MPEITIPSPAVPIATTKCPNCQATSDTILDRIWYQKLVAWLGGTNAGTTDIAAIKADIIAIKAFVGMP